MSNSAFLQIEVEPYRQQKELAPESGPKRNPLIANDDAGASQQAQSPLRRRIAVSRLGA
jgi:hypothetical protein